MTPKLIRESLRAKIRQAFETRGIRKPRTEDIFARRCYFAPSDFYVAGYLKSKPLAAFNPGAIGREEITLFPRLIFDYYKYVSSIGATTIDLQRLVEGNIETPLMTRIILWPQELWEFLGCEDARAFLYNDSILMLYTGKGYYYDKNKLLRRDTLAFAELNLQWRLKRKGYFTMTSKEGEIFVPPSNKDSAFLKIKQNKATILTRPEINLTRICWRGEVNLDDLSMVEETLEPVMPSEKWELKVGWSTNAIRLSSNEYLIGWHGVVKDDLSYRNGLALVDSDGHLLAISDYLLSPKGLLEEYGDRPLVIFGDGLLTCKDLLVWIGGISDYTIGVFVTEIKEALERLRPVRYQH
jgi:predicted GH43/DUF377 family glycosyl hydrolase